MTKEEKSEYNKKWREANLEKRKAYDKAYHKANKEKRAAYDKDRWEAKKDVLYTVYYLKEDHYVGMTNSLKARLLQHKNVRKRHIEDVEIIGKYEKEEATRVEAALHAMGYLGKHPGRGGNKNYKQLNN